MQNLIAGAMATLGVLLVLSGGAVIVSRALNAEPATDAPVADGAAGPSRATARLATAVRNLPAADRLIGWGVVLLVLGAVAAGAISFNLGANAGTR